MTREHKLALIIGFTLILVVGVLISDHLSKARQLKFASVTVDEEPTALALEAAADPLREWFEKNAQQDLAAAASTTQVPGTSAPTSAPAHTDAETPMVLTPETRQHDAGPLVIGQGRLGSETGNLEEAIRRAGGEIATDPTGMPVLTVPTPAPATTETRTASKPESTPKFAPVDEKDVTIYRIQSKDSLYSIAKATYGDGNLWRQLAAYNEGRVGKDGAVRVGATLKLPPKHVLTGGAPERTAKPAETKTLAQQDEKPAKKAEPQKPTETKAGTTYTVVKGDSLSKIAERLLGSKSRADEILKANAGVIKDPDDIKIGMTLKIPPK